MKYYYYCFQTHRNKVEYVNPFSLAATLKPIKEHNTIDEAINTLNEEFEAKKNQPIYTHMILDEQNRIVYIKYENGESGYVHIKDTL